MMVEKRSSMSRAVLRSGAVPLSLGALFVGACISPPVEAPKTTVEQQTDVSTEQNLKDQVDLLFMIDDSGSMAPKQQRLRDTFPQLISVLDTFGKDTPASYHIGVITSDIGAPGITCGANRGGKLQAKGAAAMNCSGPTSGNFLIYDQKNHANDNIPAGQDLPKTFTCMASVGEKGCGFEMQLEATYRALHDAIPENQGFLRPGAILAIVFVTDEDDCSVDNGASDLFGGNQTYGNLASYRCTRFGISCDGQFPLPSSPQASFQSCSPATKDQGNKLADMAKYINFFTQAKAKGGVKENPKDVVLAAIDASSLPFGTTTGSSPDICGSGTNTCTILGHSCTNPNDQAFFGDPAVRINTLLARSNGATIANICGDNDTYKTALEGIGQKILSALKPSCLTSPIANPADPDCNVEDVTTTGGVDVHKAIPFCDKIGGTPPAGGACYRVKTVPDCKAVCNPKDGKYQQIGIDIDRGGGTAPPNTVANIACATIAIANEDPDAKCKGSM